MELVGGGLILEDRDASRIRTDDDIVCEPPLLAQFSSQHVLCTLFPTASSSSSGRADLMSLPKHH